MKNTIDPCLGKLSDMEYLEHMIPHHQVAVDMSIMLMNTTKNPVMLHLCRDIIRKQQYEIWEMNLLINKFSETIFSDNIASKDQSFTKLDKYASKLSSDKDGVCNPLFFKPDEHDAHMKHMEVTVKSYLEHMIPHHQVAVDMSHRLLIHTNHSYLMDFCRKLIIDQQGEIFLMNNFLNNLEMYNSELL